MSATVSKATFTFDIDRTVQLNQNDMRRLHWSAAKKRTKYLREVGCLTAKTQFPRNRQVLIPGMHKVVIRFTPALRTPAKFDAPNWYPTFKALIDGLVDAKIIEDDQSLMQTRMVIVPDLQEPRRQQHRIVIEVEAYGDNRD